VRLGKHIGGESKYHGHPGGDHKPLHRILRETEKVTNRAKAYFLENFAENFVGMEMSNALACSYTGS
jgi:hypothetical protein